MNAKLTAAAAILVVAIVGLAAFEGSTNSWWSDEEDASLEIQTGGLDLAVENYKLSIDGVDVACEAGKDQDTTRTTPPWSTYALLKRAYIWSRGLL